MKLVSRIRRRPSIPVDDDEGTILIVTIGYAVLALVVILVGVDATSAHLEQKRLDTVVDAAVLAAADGFELAVTDGLPTARPT